jgi:hypothetical protein
VFGVLIAYQLAIGHDNNKEKQVVASYTKAAALELILLEGHASMLEKGASDETYDIYPSGVRKPVIIYRILSDMQNAKYYNEQTVLALANAMACYDTIFSVVHTVKQGEYFREVTYRKLRALSSAMSEVLSTEAKYIEGSISDGVRNQRISDSMATYFGVSVQIESNEKLKAFIGLDRYVQELAGRRADKREDFSFSRNGCI